MTKEEAQMFNAKVWEALTRGPDAVWDQLAAVTAAAKEDNDRYDMGLRPLIDSQRDMIDRLAEASLLELGLDEPLMETVLAAAIEQCIDDFIDSLDGYDSSEEKRLDDAERARAINRGR